MLTGFTFLTRRAKKSTDIRLISFRTSKISSLFLCIPRGPLLYLHQRLCHLKLLQPHWTKTTYCGKLASLSGGYSAKLTIQSLQDWRDSDTHFLVELLDACRRYTACASSHFRILSLLCEGRWLIPIFLLRLGGHWCAKESAHGCGSRKSPKSSFLHFIFCKLVCCHSLPG